jgi:hypothetical protein
MWTNDNGRGDENRAKFNTGNVSYTNGVDDVASVLTHTGGGTR